MEPKIVDVDEFKIIGLEYVGKNQNGDIPQLWEKFVSRVDEIENAVNPEILYGVCYSLHDDGSFSYIACQRVESIQEVPDGLVGKTVPTGKYAVFTHKGSLNGLRSTYDQIYKTWLPKSGHKQTLAPEFELYDERFDNSKNSEMDIYIPIE